MKIADLFIIFLLVLSLFIALAILFRAWRYRPRPVVTSFLWLMAAIVWWLLSAIIENMSTNPSLSIFWMKMCYLGITTLPVIWLVFTLQYSDRGKWLTRRGLVLLLILPTVTLIMVWSNDIHHLIWKNIVVDTNLYPMVKTVTYNAWFWVHAIYSYVLLLAGTINLFGLFFRTSSIFRKQTGILLLASFTPWVANLLFITGIVPSFSIDPTPMAFVVTGATILWGLSRTQLLHMMPIAYEAIFRSMTDGVIIIDQQNFIVETNSAAQRILKLNKSEIIGKTLNQVIPGHEYSLEPKTDMAVNELTISLEQDQMERFYNLYVSPIVAGQRFSGLIVLLHDDTERRKAENESREKAALETELNERKQAENTLKHALAGLEHSSAQLKATNKELESFSYSVSHDLRSPLRSIDGFSQALLEDYNARLDETGRDYLRRLRSASQKMGELIDGLLKLSRLTRSEMHPQKVDLSALAEDISTRLQETHPDKRVKLVIDSGLSADGDPQLLRVLLENLLGNAWKFTGKTPRARIEFGSTANGGEKTFFIKDNGAGFDMAYKDRLFGAFQRLHDTADFPGTGIGLATVQRIINRHGGSIRAEGAVGKGAAFYFTLS